jgi:ligand-binding sensor domain-containing protein/signal transduction histidine kinase
MNPAPAETNRSFGRWLWILLVGCGFFFSIQTRADSQFSSRLWQVEDGLPHNIVQALTQTAEGYLWVGTREGLARFDGVNFTLLEFPGPIPHPSVTALCEDLDGGLWIGTENAGFYLLKEGKLLRRNLNNGVHELIALDIKNGADCMWVGADAGIAQITRDKTVYPKGIGIATAVAVDPDGSVWVSGEGVKHLKADGTVEKYSPQSGTLPTPRKIYRDRNGVLWCGGTGGLTRVEHDEAVYYDKGQGPPGIISVLFEDRQGTLWVGTYGGLSRFANGKFVQENEQSAYRVYAICEDKEANIWVGSEEGLSRLTRKYFTTYTRQNGLAENMITSVCAGSDGSTWVAAWGGGLNHIKNGAITLFSRSNGLASDFVLGLCEGRDGSFWAGMDYGVGLDQFKDGKIIHYGKQNGMAGSAVTAILDDNAGNLWVGTRDALNRFTDGKFSVFTKSEGLSDSKVNALCESHDGVIWIGTERGLTQFQRDKLSGLGKREPLLKCPILSLYEDAEHTLWIGTRDGGLRWMRDGKVNVVTAEEGLAGDSIYSILEDERHNLWLASSKGIFHVNKLSLHEYGEGLRQSVDSVTYGKVDGIISGEQYREVTQPVACKTKDGRLWFRTTQGVAVVNPNEITPNPTPPPVMIEEVIVNKERWPGADRRPKPNGSQPDVASHFVKVPDRIRIPPGRGELEIHYTALRFRAPEKSYFKYKLQGVDEDWIEAGERRVAYYNNLRPGNYEFRVIACDSSGIWNNIGAGLKLTFDPHFWQSRWFILSSGLGFVLVIGASVRQVTRRKLQRRLARAEQQHAIEKERTRIARDIHDNLGAQLTRISMLSELAGREARPESATGGHVRNIYGTAQEMLAQLDETVWAVNPSNDRLDRLAEYILHFGEEFFRYSDIRCRFKVPDDIPQLDVAAELRHNIFLTVKEALNNAARHSGATDILVQMEFGTGVFAITVRDNGRGFDTAECAARNRGLQNMRVRTEGLNGRFAIESRAGEGATIRMEFRIKSNHNGVPEPSK